MHCSMPASDKPPTSQLEKLAEDVPMAFLKSHMHAFHYEVVVLDFVVMK